MLPGVGSFAPAGLVIHLLADRFITGLTTTADRDTAGHARHDDVTQ